MISKRKPRHDFDAGTKIGGALYQIQLACGPRTLAKLICGDPDAPTDRIVQQAQGMEVWLVLRPAERKRITAEKISAAIEDLRRK